MKEFTLFHSVSASNLFFSDNWFILIIYLIANCLEDHMLQWVLTFLIIALIAAVLGFTSIAQTAASVAQVIFFIFLVLFVISLVLHLVKRGK